MPIISPDADLANQRNLDVQRQVRNALKAHGWKLYQPILGAGMRAVGSRDATLFKIVGPMMIEIRLRILMGKDSKSGVIALRTGKAEGPLLTYGSHMLGRSPDREKYDIPIKDALAVQSTFHQEFVRNYFEESFDGVGATDEVVSHAIDWLLHFQERWTNAALDLLSAFAQARWHLVQMDGGKEVGRTTFDEEWKAEREKAILKGRGTYVIEKEVLPRV